MCISEAPRNTAPTTGSAWTAVAAAGGEAGEAAAGGCGRVQPGADRAAPNSRIIKADRTRITVDHA
ncbi:MAG: hypothetical protein JO191_10535 [Mycobacteriaceae bacterium]|nr:hypothetical protein [Mycobacteriaceae bacterium]